MLYVLVLGLFARATSERVLVVTPQSRLPEDDSYVEAYRDTASDRRSPLGSYEESYNTLDHPFHFIEGDVHPELNYDATQLRKPSNHHRHRHPPIPFPPPHHYHYHHQEPDHVHSHHVFPQFHFVTAFLHKFGLHKAVKIAAKIAVLAVILKFITAVAVFLVLPAFVPQDKEKEDAADDDDDDGILKSLGDITDKVWNGIAAREKMEVSRRREDRQCQHSRGIQASNAEIHHNPAPPQHVMHHLDQCREKDKNECGDADKDGEEEGDGHDELDDVDAKLVKKIIEQWKEENFGGPDKSSAISFLRTCVSTANRILGILLGYLKMKNGNMDVLDGMMLHHFSAYVKGLVKMWPHVVSVWKG